MNISDLENKQVAILGFGREGKAVLSFLQKHHIRPAIFDEKQFGSMEEEDQILLKNSELPFITGPEAFKELTGFEVLFRSPGVHRLHPEVLAAEKKGAIITSQTKWFFEHARGTIIGVTGTKGKGTCSSLIYEMLNKALENKDFSGPILTEQSRVYLTGNIGKDAPFEILEQLTDKDAIVYELSSFQLQDLEVSPRIGVCLMVTSDHLDVHKTEEEYISAKQAILKFQKPGDVGIVNADYENSVAIGKLGQGTKYYFSRHKQVETGAYMEGWNVLVKNLNGEHSFNTTSKLLRGNHNLENICGSVLAATAAGAGDKSIQEVINSFKGLEHRLEFITTQDGISFYNDSISTTGDTSIAAIASFTEPLILILGGSDKGLDFTQLANVIAESHNIKHIIVIGQTAPKILDALNNTNFHGRISTGASSMEEVFDQIKGAAHTGDVVLLSPACASFGMFKNYADRGNQFKKLALAWQKQ